MRSRDTGYAGVISRLECQSKFIRLHGTTCFSNVHQQELPMPLRLKAATMLRIAETRLILGRFGFEKVASSALHQHRRNSTTLTVFRTSLLRFLARTACVTCLFERKTCMANGNSLDADVSAINSNPQRSCCKVVDVLA